MIYLCNVPDNVLPSSPGQAERTSQRLNDIEKQVSALRGEYDRVRKACDHTYECGKSSIEEFYEYEQCWLECIACGTKNLK